MELLPLFAAKLDIVDALLKLMGPVVGLLLGWFWGQWQANADWKKKEFKSNILLSLNSVKTLSSVASGGEEQAKGPVASLKLRTLFERDVQAVFPNRAMSNAIKAAANQTGPGDPLLRFPKEDSWFYLNAVLNKIAEQFAVGTLRADMGGEVTKRWYTFCLTFEHEDRMHQLKTRILLIEREALLNFPDTGEIQLESPKHDLRVETLRILKREYKSNPHLFMDIELSL